MGMPWVCVVPKLPTVRLMGLIVETLDPTDTYAQRRLKAVDFSLAGFAISGAKSVAAAVAMGASASRSAIPDQTSRPPIQLAGTGTSP